jgi:flagellar basal body-associated protein FliL
MNDPRKKKNPTLGVAIFIVVVVLLVIATILYNAITEKREYDQANAGASDTTASAASAAAAAVNAAKGASQ